MSWPYRQPWVRTRIWVERRRRLFYRVIVFRDQASMLRYHSEQRRIWKGHRGRSGHFWAQVSYWRSTHVGPRGGERSEPCTGEIILCAEAVGGGVVAHEMTHAALYYLNGRVPGACEQTLDQVVHGPHDERLAWTAGWLVTQFYRWWYRTKVGRPA